ncbi:MAG TPA: hypothetical protein VEH56_06265, partial [Candidatus Saccharimonadales bacterium]|nr:hypothetical protein [Candidatus Saccharimonadales bacterium]
MTMNQNRLGLAIEYGNQRRRVDELNIVGKKRRNGGDNGEARTAVTRPPSFEPRNTSPENWKLHHTHHTC